MEFLFSIALLKVSLSAYNECLGGSISVSGNNLRCTYTILPGAELVSTKNLLETKGVLSFKFGRSPDPLAIHKRCLDYVANKSAVIIELVSLDGSETVCHLKTFQEYPERSSLGEGYVGYERKFFRCFDYLQRRIHDQFTCGGCHPVSKLCWRYCGDYTGWSCAVKGPSGWKYPCRHDIDCPGYEYSTRAPCYELCSFYM